MSNLTFDSRDLEEYIKKELPLYIKNINGLENIILTYQDNITREQPIFPCFSFEVFSQGAVQKFIDSDNIENATKILLDLDIYTNDEGSIPYSSRDLANAISIGTAQFINEKLGMVLSQNDRVPNALEFIFRKKIRATGYIDNNENIIFTN